jgi:hypothetical protein
MGEKAQGKKAQGEQPKMSRGEAQMLLQHARRREAVAISHVKAAGAAQKAEFETKMAHQWSAEDARWKAQMQRAEEAAEALQEQVTAEIVAEGFPEEWAPHVYVGMTRRGENGSKDRREELRKAAYACIEERVAAATARAKEKIVVYEGQILAGHLTSEAAVAVLNALPAMVSILPPLDEEELEQKRLLLEERAREDRPRWMR